MFHWSNQNFTGRQFGHLTVIGVEASINSQPIWLCQCTCGTRIALRAGSLVRGRARSCGRCVAVPATQQRRRRLSLNDAWKEVQSTWPAKLQQMLRDNPPE